MKKSLKIKTSIKYNEIKLQILSFLDFIEKSKLLNESGANANVFTSPLKLSNWMSLVSSFAGMSLHESSSNPEDKQLIYAPLLQQVSDLIKIHSKQKGNMERTFVVEKITAFSHSFSVYLNEIAVSIQSKNSTLAEFLQKLPDEKDQFETLLAFLKSQSIIVTSGRKSLRHTSQSHARLSYL